MTKTRLLVSLMVIALAAALIGGATMAWFTDEDATEPVTMTAGTLMIEMTDLQLIEDVANINLGILNPGDTWEWQFDVENIGTKSFNWGIYVCWQDIIGQLNEELDEDMRASLEDKGYGTDELSDVLEWKVYVNYGDGEELLVEGVLPDDGPIGAYMDDPLAAGDDPVKVRIVALLPDEAGNEYQGSTMDIALGVMAWQTTNGAPAPTLDDVVCPFADEGNGDDPGDDPGEEPNYSQYNAAFWSSNSGGSNSNTIILEQNKTQIRNAKDENGDAINGSYNVELYIDQIPGATYPVVANFTNGSSQEFPINWTINNPDGVRVNWPGGIKVKFVSAAD